MDKTKLKDIILKTLEKEGGAAGLKALAKAAKTSKGKLKKDLNKMSGVKQHQDGDYISTPINDSKRVNPNIIRREIEKQRRVAQAPHSMDRTNPRRIKQLRDKYFDYLDNIDVEDQTMPFPWGLFIPKGLIYYPSEEAQISASMAEVQQVENKVEESPYRYELRTSTRSLKEIKEIVEVMLDEKKKKKKDRCHRKADQVYGTKTSAYKSGAIVKCRKGMIWKVGSKKKKKK